LFQACPLANPAAGISEITSGLRQIMVNKVFMVNQLSIPWVDFDP